MIGQTIQHYKILEKLGEVRLRKSFVAQDGPNSAKALMNGLVRRSFKIIDFNL